jgi:hypothetical protein
LHAMQALLRTNLHLEVRHKSHLDHLDRGNRILLTLTMIWSTLQFLTTITRDPSLLVLALMNRGITSQTVRP